MKVKIFRMVGVMSILILLCASLNVSAESLGTLDFEDDFALTDLANWDAPAGRYRVFEVVDGRLSAKANSDNSSAARIKGKSYDNFNMTFNLKTSFGSDYSSYCKVELWDAENKNDFLMFKKNKIAFYDGSAQQDLGQYDIEDDTIYDVKIEAENELSVYIKKQSEEEYTYIGTTNGLRIPSARSIVFGQQGIKISIDDVRVYIPEEEPDIPDIPDVPVPDPNNGEWTLNFKDDFALTDLANWDAPSGRYRVFEVVNGRLSAKAASDNSSAARIKDKIYDDFLLTFNLKTDYSVNASYAKVELWNSDTNINDWLIFRSDRITHYNGNTETKLSDYSIQSNTEYDILIKASDEAEIYIKKHDEENYIYIGKTSGFRVPSSRYIVFGQKDLKISIDDVNVYVPYVPSAAEFAGSSPANGTVEVDVASKIELDFTDAMDESTINASTVIVSGGSESVSYTVSKISDTKYEISFNTQLEHLTEYTVSLSDEIKDINGGAIEAAEFSFTTESSGEWSLQFSDDFTETDLAKWDAPTGRYKVFEVVDGRMTAKATSDNSSAARIMGKKWDSFKLDFNISTNYTSNEYFKVELWDEQNNSDWLMFRSDRITYYNGQGETLIGNYSISSGVVYDVKIAALGDTAKIYIKPHTEKGYIYVGETPAMKITNNRDIVFGQTNLKISIDDVNVYTIEAPELISFLPADQAQDVAVDTEIILNFSKDVDISTIKADTVIISDGTKNVQFNVTKVSNGQYSLKPLDNLSYFSKYTVSITNGVKDKYGQSVGEKSFTFRTEEQPPEIDVLGRIFEIINGDISKPVTALESGRLRCGVTIKNNTDSEKNLVVILALYKVDGDIKSMEDIVMQEETLAVSGGGQKISVDINVPEAAGHSVGLFIWDRIDTMIPIAPYTELK